MDPIRFSDLTEEEKGWLDAWLDGTITPKDFEALQDRLMENAGLRAVMRRYLALDDSLRNDLGGGETASDAATAPWVKLEDPIEVDTFVPGKVIRFPALASMAAAAAFAFLLGLAFMYWGYRPDPGSEDIGALAIAKPEEPSARGFAAIGRLINATWPEGGSSHREGDTLGAEVFQLAAGTAEIQFFSGATMTVEGPAEISLKSAWEASCREGAVRMQVPPAARGFKLHAPATEIVDLGTEFGLSVRDGKSQVEVFDGEIAIRHQGADEQLVKKGAALDLPPDGGVTPTETSRLIFPDLKKFGDQGEAQLRADFERWQSHRDALAKDKRLISYYTFDRENPDSLIPNLTMPQNPEFDGAAVLAEPVDGRWPGLKSALEFRRPGARVRVNIPGEFPAFTFMAWVRIDSLDRRYNALFMGDGYETGEPHWQIREDGAMMLSVMVDDTKPNPGAPNDAGLHRVYYSPPMWDLSMSGQWQHLTSVFDPAGQAVSHFVNGERISTQEIEDRFFIETLRIGNGEIGNWDLPFREDPWFAIRNLNGRMDEFAIFQAALSEKEIASLHEASRSGRR